MAQSTRIFEGIGGNRWMAHAGIDRRHRSIGSLPSPWEQARRAGVVAQVGNVTTRAAYDEARRTHLAITDPDTLRAATADRTSVDPIEAATRDKDYGLRVVQHGGELLVQQVALDSETEGASLADEVALELDLAALTTPELTGAPTF